MTTNVRKQKTITAIFWSVMAIMLLAMGIYAIRDLPMRLAMKVSPNIHLAIEMSTDNSTYKTVFKNYGNETLDPSISRAIEDGNKITLTGDIFNNIYSNEPLYIRITNYTQASDVNDTINYANGPALSAYFTDDNGVTNYPSYGVQNIAPYINGNTPSAKTFIVIPQSVIVDSSYEFNLKLELSNFVSTEYTVTQTLGTGIVSLNNFATTKAVMGQDFETIFVADQDNLAIAITSVKVNNVEIAENLYSFNTETGAFVLKQQAMIQSGTTYFVNTTPISITTALKPASVNVYVYDESENASLIRYNLKSYYNGDTFDIPTNERFSANLIKIDTVANLWLTINGEYSENYSFDQPSGLLRISQNALAGDIAIHIFSYWTGNVASSFAGGNGTSADPYKICSPSQLAILGPTTNAGTTYSGVYFELKNDLYLNDELFTWSTATGYVTASDGVHSVRIGTGIPTDLGASTATTMGELYGAYTGTLHQFTPIGTVANNFCGNFNGNNFVINNCYFNDITKIDVGLFGFLGGAKIENVILRNSLEIGICVAGNLVARGYNSTIINNCKVSDSYLCSMVSNDTYTESNSGAICGRLYNSNVRNCGSYNVYNFSNGYWASGCVGQITGGSSVHNSYVANSTIISNSLGIGGFAGISAWRGKINNCYAYGISLIVNGSLYSKFLGCYSYDQVYADYCYYEGTSISGGYTGGGSLTATNCSQINGNTLVTETYGTYVLVEALNAWVTANQTSPATYKTWQVTAGVNGGYPYFA